MTIRQIRLTAAITLISISSLLSQAQNYVIYHVTGNAYTLNNTKATPVTKGKTVKGSTLLRIDTKGEVWLQENNRQRTIYKLRSGTGKQGTPVKDLVAKANQHKRADISDINKLITAGIAQGKGSGDGFARHGVSHVTNASGDQTTLASMIGPDAIEPSTYRPVTVRKINDGNNIYHFRFNNKSENALHANIIMKDCTPESMEFMLPENIILDKQKVTELADIQFAVPEAPFAGFILILSEAPFSFTDIKNELEVGTQDIDRTYVYELIR